MAVTLNIFVPTSKFDDLSVLGQIVTYPEETIDLLFRMYLAYDMALFFVTIWCLLLLGLILIIFFYFFYNDILQELE
jgi:hypothetical protein